MSILKQSELSKFKKKRFSKNVQKFKFIKSNFSQKQFKSLNQGLNIFENYHSFGCFLKNSNLKYEDSDHSTRR